MLQILDDGRVTDSHGRTVDFKNTVIIMTSNIGSQYLLDGVTAAGTLKDQARDQVLGELRQRFRPEFLNRVDDIVMFTPLNIEQIKQIVSLMTTSLGARLKDRNIRFELTEAARDHVAREGFDPVYGARPLKRYLQHAVETKIARALLSGEVAEGGLVRVDAKKGALVVELLPPETPLGARPSSALN